MAYFHAKLDRTINGSEDLRRNLYIIYQMMKFMYNLEFKLESKSQHKKLCVLEKTQGANSNLWLAQLKEAE